MAKFRTKNQGYGKANRSWVCAAGGTYHRKKVKKCMVCGSTALHYFQSDAELNRYIDLGLLAKAGQITDLEVHPKYELFVSDLRGKRAKAFAYTADFRYIDRTGQTIVEDVKPRLDPASWSREFKLKRKCIELQYGIEIEIYAEK